ncbi:hypothetical protein [Thalassotalea marina]|uniref:PEP-CTERM sorting domain-containing protein n=1 Tax=Thalassotalea marina TaxID=1673741 RepID=A0A919EKP8_9GAMM|nr:hypothetical protein [Thalassotalea marina]GHF95830.1 hypothetical protein GCM10017161_25180 [Thalassotalea marina]
MNQLRLLALLLCCSILSTSANANIIKYTLEGILEDSPNSTDVYYGGDGDPFNTTDDGTKFTINFQIGESELNIKSTHMTEYGLYNNYKVQMKGYDITPYVPELYVGFRPAVLSNGSSDLDSVFVELIIGPSFLNLSKIHVSILAKNLFSGDLTKPAINPDYKILGSASRNSKYVLRGLSVKSTQTTPIPEPLTLLTFGLGLLLVRSRLFSKR